MRTVSTVYSKFGNFEMPHVHTQKSGTGEPFSRRTYLNMRHHSCFVHHSSLSSDHHYRMDLPPLPPLQQRILDLARTHKSHDFRPVGGGAQDADGEPRDWDRLAFLGEGVLFSTTSNLLYKVLPRKKSSFLKVISAPLTAPTPIFPC